MAIPALRIPMGLDTQSFEKSIGEAKSLTSSATNFLVKEFAKTQLKLVVNSEQFKPGVQAATKFLGDEFAKVKPQIQSATQAIVKETTETALKATNVLATPAIKGAFQAFTAVGVPAVQGLAASLGPLAAGGLAVYAAFELVTGIVRSAREQIAAMVAVADKASNFKVSPQFLQLFEGEARKLKVTTEELDAALSHAFNATKEKSPIDVSKFEAAGERITDIELALRVYNQELEKATGKSLQGLVLFRDADTQEQKVRAVLLAMTELNVAGQQAASLDLGEKFFGTALVDRIRQGKTSAEGMLETMDRLAKSQEGLFPTELVQRAKEVDEQLKLSEDRLSRAMKPAWDDIAQIILTIKGYWTDVVNLIAKGVEYLNSFDGKKALPPVVVTDDKPSRGTGSAPTLKKTGADEKRDPFDVAVDNIEKHIATLNADTAAAFQNKAAQAELRAEFQELTALKRGDAGVTQQQIDAYQNYRKEMSASEALIAAGIKLTNEQEAAFLSSSHGIRVATEAYGKASEALNKINSASAQLGSALSSSFADAVIEGKKLDEVLSSLLKTLAKAAINSVFGSIFNAPAAGGLSPFASMFSGLIGKNAEGTDNWRGGLSLVGEKGPEVVHIPRGAQVIPNDVLRQGGNSGPSISNVFHVAGDVSQGTIDRMQRMIIATQRGQQQTNKMISSTQRYQATGVS